MKTWQRLTDNPTLRDQYAKRSRVVKAIRDYFWQEGFLEVETPQVVPLPSMEPYLEVFETTLLDEHKNPHRAFLTSSPEFAMKKLLVGGYEKLFQVCKSFRNQEGWGGRHNPEFTILEWYRTNADYTAIMADCEGLLRYISETVNGSALLNYQGKTYDLTKPWERISVAEAFQKYAAIDVETMLDTEKLRAACAAKNYQVDASTSWDDLFYQVFLNEIEPHLGADQPTILYDYPVAQAALSRRKAEDPRFAERFEFYINGVELGNAFSELTDWQEQLTRLQADRSEKENLGRTLFDVDMDFIDALKTGMPPAAGIAVGVDRLAMLFADTTDINDVIFFSAREMWQAEE